MINRILSLIVVMGTLWVAEGGIHFKIKFTNQEKINECRINYEKVTDLTTLQSFLGQLIRSREGGRLKLNEMSECLGLEPSFANEATNKFKIMIQKAKFKRICHVDHLDEIVEYDKKMATNSDETKRLGLAHWWRKFVQQVLVKCKLSLANKFFDEQRKDKDIEIVLKGTLNLAQNFNWLDTSNLIINEEPRSIKMLDDTTMMSLDQLVDLVPTSGDFTDILQTDELPEFKDDLAFRPHLYVSLKRSSSDHLSHMFLLCSRLMAYRALLIDPLIRLMNQGYNYENNEGNNNQEAFKYFKLWITAIQMCQLTRNLTVMKSNINTEPVTLIFKAGVERKFYPKIGYEYLPGCTGDQTTTIKRSYEYPPEFDQFIEFETNLDQLNWLPREDVQARLTKKRSQAKEIAPFLLSQKFLEIFANFFQSDNQNDFCTVRELEELAENKERGLIAPQLDPSDECPICLDELINGPVTVTSCHHKMHTLCLKEYARNNPIGARSCPICRSPIGISAT